MGVTATSGPQITYGITTTASGAVTEYNEERGPNLFDLGFGIMDPRPFYNYDPGSPPGTKIGGWWGTKALVDFLPSIVSTQALFVTTTATAVGGTTLTLSPSASAGAIQTTIIAPESGLSVSVIAIGSTAIVAPQLTFGSAGTIAPWNPAAGVGRCITINPSSNLDAGTYTIAGRDMYGFKMTETIVSSGGVKTSQKAFKYISAITASTTITSTGLAIGISDTYGFPLKATTTGPGLYYNVQANSSTALAIVLSTGAITVGSTATTATSTTGDPRGTYASTTASDGTVRIVMAQEFGPNRLANVTASDFSPIFGHTPFSSV